MSGIEIAGLVLGGFPLIISALEHYRQCFEPLQDWWKFETEFTKFMNDVEFEKNRFDMNLEKLLSPFFTSDSEMNRLLQDCDGIAWKEPTLCFRLGQRLGKSHEIFMFIVKDMNSELEALKKRLRVEKVMNMPSETSKWEHELLRLRVSFSKKKFRHLKSLAAGNTKLHTLLGANDELAGHRRVRKTKGMASFVQDARRRMKNLHSTLQGGWTCRAHASHNCLLALEERKVNDNPGNLTIHLLFEAIPVLQPIRVEIFEDAATSPSAPPSVRGIHPEPWTNSPAGKANKPTLPSSSLSFRSKNPVTAQPRPESENKSTPPQKPKVRKKLRFHDLKDSETPAPVPTPTIPLICDLCSTLSGNLRPGCLGYLTGSSTLRHNLFIGDSKPLSCDDHSLQALDQTVLPSGRGKSPIASQQRFNIALVLASSLLRLDGTLWIDGSWSKSNIFFLHDEAHQQLLVKHPYVFQSFCASIQSVQPTPTPKACKDSFLALGIMLLELAFGETLEAQPFRSKYLGPDGNPNEYTDLCTAKEWQTKLQEMYGDDLALVIDRCLDCSFGLRPDWNDAEFVEAVVADVVQPLEDFLVLWNGRVGGI